ncbi:hypothetical protein HAX54_018041 [Datura stramonium]|uniref:Uncharacterized protein n=1 Tax=Datura stramonium TaxID=4076 RepID=A0ABS8ULV2_DATST|nr:hypothetical protein [Datura stramonium]
MDGLNTTFFKFRSDGSCQEGNCGAGILSETAMTNSSYLVLCFLDLTAEGRNDHILDQTAEGRNDHILDQTAEGLSVQKSDDRQDHAKITGNTGDKSARVAVVAKLWVQDHKNQRFRSSYLRQNSITM